MQGDGALGMTQIGEIVGKSGAVFVGPLPEKIQNYTVFAVGRPVGAKQSEAVATFLDFLKTPIAITTMKAKGMQVNRTNRNRDGNRTDRTAPQANKAYDRQGQGVKARVFPYLLPLCVFFLTACGPTASRSPADVVTFDTAKRLDDDAGRALAQINGEPSENRLSFAIYRPFSGRDAYVSTRYMTMSGKVDRSAGIFLRFRSADDYYAVCASALENNVKLYRVVAGKRQMIGFMEVNVSSQAWHTLGIAARDDRLTVLFDGRELFVASDRRLPGPPGKVGLWTQADSMTWFESLKIGSLD
jgi:hypothetical protein